jgi:hypothetical protein
MSSAFKEKIRKKMEKEKSGKNNTNHNKTKK